MDSQEIKKVRKLVQKQIDKIKNAPILIRDITVRDGMYEVDFSIKSGSGRRFDCLDIASEIESRLHNDGRKDIKVKPLNL